MTTETPTPCVDCGQTRLPLSEIAEHSMTCPGCGLPMTSHPKKIRKPRGRTILRLTETATVWVETIRSSEVRGYADKYLSIHFKGSELSVPFATKEAALEAHRKLTEAMENC